MFFVLLRTFSVDCTFRRKAWPTWSKGRCLMAYERGRDPIKPETSSYVYTGASFTALLTAVIRDLIRLFFGSAPPPACSTNTHTQSRAFPFNKIRIFGQVSRLPEELRRDASARRNARILKRGNRKRYTCGT